MQTLTLIVSIIALIISLSTFYSERPMLKARPQKLKGTEFWLDDNNEINIVVENVGKRVAHVQNIVVSFKENYEKNFFIPVIEEPLGRKPGYTDTRSNKKVIIFPGCEEVLIFSSYTRDPGGKSISTLPCNSEGREITPEVSKYHIQIEIIYSKYQTTFTFEAGACSSTQNANNFEYERVLMSSSENNKLLRDWRKKLLTIIET